MALMKFQAALTPSGVATITTAEQSFVAGPGGYDAGNSIVTVSKPSNNAGVGIAGARVIDATHIGVTFVNPTAGTVTPTAGEVYQFCLIT